MVEKTTQTAAETWNRRTETVPVKDECPDCGGEETVTSAFAADHVDELDRLSAWCETCGYGFGADELDVPEARNE